MVIMSMTVLSQDLLVEVSPGMGQSVPGDPESRGTGPCLETVCLGIWIRIKRQSPSCMLVVGRLIKFIDHCSFSVI